MTKSNTKLLWWCLWETMSERSEITTVVSAWKKIILKRFCHLAQKITKVLIILKDDYVEKLCQIQEDITIVTSYWKKMKSRGSVISLTWIPKLYQESYRVDMSMRKNHLSKTIIMFAPNISQENLEPWTSGSWKRIVHYEINSCDEKYSFVQPPWHG